jgi:peptidase M42 family hydrolase
MSTLAIDEEYLRRCLLEMLAIPCPTGFTDEIVRYVCMRLKELGIEFELTRRGTICARLEGRERGPSKAIANHLDTIGANVASLQSNGRVSLKPIGNWSSRFAEGGRVTLFSERGAFRGQVLPLLASGHAFNEQIDKLPVGWDQVELRLNTHVENDRQLAELGIQEGDFVAFDSDPEWDASGYISARHLDNKAGASALLACLKAMANSKLQPATDVYALFTVTEEVGTGAGASLAASVAEFVGIDIGPVAPGQNAREHGVTLCAQDTSGPFDRQLLRVLRQLCRDHDIDHQTDVFRYYYSDANSAIVAGHDIRHALITFGTDATHGYERTHISSLLSIARLLTHYVQQTIK